jgi:RNA recognition motif-containing protein
VVFNINPDCKEEDIYEIFKRHGEILKIKMPRDYEFPTDFQIIGDYSYDFPFELIEYPSVKDQLSDRGIRNTNFIQEISDYLLNQSSKIKIYLKNAHNDDEIATGYDKMHDYWNLARHFMEFLHVRPSPTEASIDGAFNILQTQPFTLANRKELQDLMRRVSKETVSFINSLFLNKGYCHIQFATRRSAERAILSGPILYQGNFKLKVAFDRNVPGWFYHTRLLEQAAIEELEKPKTEITNNRIDILSEVIDAKFDQTVSDLYGNNRYYYGSDDKDDPVIAGKLNTYDDALEVQASLFSQNREEISRVQSLFGKKKNTEYLMTSDEEFYKDPEQDELGLGVDVHGRLKKGGDRLRKALDEKYLMGDTTHFNYKIPESLTDSISKIHIFSPAKSLWSSFHEKQRILEKFKEAEDYFYVPLPDVIKTDPSTLVKKKYQDAPEIRFIAREEFDYSKLPERSSNQPLTPHEKVKQEIAEFVRKMTNLGQTDENGPKNNVFEDKRFGEEEAKLFKVGRDYRFYTDTEEEEKAIHAINTEDIYLEHRKDPLKFYKDRVGNLQYKNLVDEIMKHPEKSFTAKYLYKGADFETHLEQLKKDRPELVIDWEEGENGEKYIHLTLPTVLTYNYEKIKYFMDKYGDAIEAGGDELEIDQEDEELFHELNNLEIDIPRVLYEFSIQKTAIEKRKYDERVLNPATIRRIGPDFKATNYIEEFEEPGKYTFEELEKVINERA